VNVKPDTLIRWQRKGFRLFGRWKSKPTRRPRLPKDLRQLIRAMAADNPIWGGERIANELQRKLGIRVSPPAVGNPRNATAYSEAPKKLGQMVQMRSGAAIRTTRPRARRPAASPGLCFGARRDCTWWAVSPPTFSDRSSFGSIRSDSPATLVDDNACQCA
jgi:hypothetical protein